MTYGKLHGAYRPRGLQTIYCPKCEKDTPHRGFPKRCIYCGGVPNAPGAARKQERDRKFGRYQPMANARRNARIARDKREAFARAAEASRQKWEGKKSES